MKIKIEEKIKIPENISCIFENNVLICKKEKVSLSLKVKIPRISLKIENNEINLSALKANKNDRKIIYTFKAHINNIFKGLQEKFVYNLEAVNVHFPMNLKVQDNNLIISNFLGEKIPRKATIHPSAEIQVKGQNITITSHDKTAAGQTAANIETATKIKGRDRRIFQDGCYITYKPGEKK